MQAVCLRGEHGYTGSMFAFTELDEELLLGNHPSSPDDLRRLSQVGVRGVVSLQSDADLTERGLNWRLLSTAYSRLGIEAHRVPVRDFDPDDLARHLDRAIAAIDAQVSQGRRTFVHCNAGLNRSPSAVIGYVALHRQMSLEDATEWVCSRHRSVPYPEVMSRWAQQRGVRLR